MRVPPSDGRRIASQVIEGGANARFRFSASPVSGRSPRDGTTLADRLALIALLAFGPVFWIVLIGWWLS